MSPFKKWIVLPCLAVLLVLGTALGCVPSPAPGLPPDAGVPLVPDGGVAVRAGLSQDSAASSATDGAQAHTDASGAEDVSMPEDADSSAQGGASAPPSGGGAPEMLNAGQVAQDDTKWPWGYPTSSGSQPNTLYVDAYGSFHVGNYDAATYTPPAIPNRTDKKGTVHAFTPRNEPIHITSCWSEPDLQGYDCSCGREFTTVQIDPLPHKDYVWKVITQPTATAPGLRRYVCAECGAGTVEEAIPPGEPVPLPNCNPHAWTAWRVDREPTATVKGIQYRYCTVCGENEYEMLDTLYCAHEWGAWIRINDGVDECQVCQKCGAHGNQRRFVCAQHVWGEWMTIVAPTYAVQGYQRHTCQLCGGTEYEYTPKLACAAHDWGGWVVQMEPSVNGNGMQHRTCRLCEEVEWESIPALTPPPPPPPEEPTPTEPPPENPTPEPDGQ